MLKCELYDIGKDPCQHRNQSTRIIWSKQLKMYIGRRGGDHSESEQPQHGTSGQGRQGPAGESGEEGAKDGFVLSDRRVPTGTRLSKIASVSRFDRPSHVDPPQNASVEAAQR